MNKIVIGNLKMNLVNVEERDKYLEWTKKELKGKKIKEIEIVLCPPFVHLESFQKNLPKKILLGAQDCFSEDKGSYTGEISPLMLKDLGVEVVLIGHSERRRFQAESDEEINQKTKKTLKAGLRTVLCVGESKLERSEGRFAQILENQLREDLLEIKRAQLDRLIIAYEPVWSIGTNNIPTSNEIMEVKVLIRKILIDLFGKKYGQIPPIIYGGNVNSKTVGATCLAADMDGVLIGRESLLPSEFMRIVQMVDNSVC